MPMPMARPTPTPTDADKRWLRRWRRPWAGGAGCSGGGHGHRGGRPPGGGASAQYAGAPAASAAPSWPRPPAAAAAEDPLEATTKTVTISEEKPEAVEGESATTEAEPEVPEIVIPDELPWQKWLDNIRHLEYWISVAFDLRFRSFSKII